MELSKVWFYERFKRLDAIRVETHFGKGANTLGFSLSIGNDSENTFQFTLGIPFLFLLYLTIDFYPWKWWRNLLGKADDRDVIRIHFTDQYINLALWHDTYDWTKGEYNGLGYIKPWKDLLCGDFDLQCLSEEKIVLERPAVPHLGQPDGIPYAKWTITHVGEKVVWQRWYMRLWSKICPQVYHNFRVEPWFVAAFPGKNGDDHIHKLHVTTVDTAEEAVDYFNKRLTELQTRY